MDEYNTVKQSSTGNIRREEEVFEITDFTNSSDWERFITQIEETISEWQLNSYVKFRPLAQNELASGEWESKISNLSFTNVPFTLTLYQLKIKEGSEQYMDEVNEENEQMLFPQYIEDMMNTNNDFPPRAHCLARWYGLRCFMVLAISSGNGIASESKCNLLCSSASIALCNTSCDVPFFVQVQENWRRLYAGCALSSGLSTEFEMVHLKKCPVQYSNLSELMSVFKSKIGLTSMMSGATKVSARFTYLLKDWGKEGKWPSKQPDYEALASHYGSLLCGSYEDPVTELQLAATWPSMMGDMIIDNKFHSYFRPLNAPRWSIRLCYADDVHYLLSSYLFEFYKITDRQESMADLLNVLLDDSERNMGQALNKITDPQNNVLPIVPVKLQSGISKVVSDPQALLRKGAYTLGRIAAVRERIPKDVLFDLKSFLFFETSSERAPKMEGLSPSMYALSHKLKSAPVDSLTYRLALCAIVVNMCHGGLSALAQLWHLFVSELRSMLDSGTLLPGIESSYPDLKTSLLHQKLQMLNCCIQCKRRRDERKPGGSDSCSSFRTAFDENMKSESCSSFQTAATFKSDNPTYNISTLDKAESDIETVEKVHLDDSVDHSETDLSNTDETSENPVADSNTGGNDVIVTPKSPVRAASLQSEDSDDEFYECESAISATNEEEVDSDVEAPNITEEVDACDRVDAETSGSLIAQIMDDSYPAEGRASICEDLKLLHFDKFLYIPFTQDHAPVTEDLLEEQADVFSKLGDTQEGSRVRARMQSASLLSDMQAFKAANPGCCLEDFVRWYSPKDFEDGKLSGRMLIPNNLWVTTWTAAKPAPISRQKRIFDDTKEAERVLHFLANLKPSEVAQLLIPVCTHEAIMAVRLAAQSMSEALPSLPLICDQIESKASKLFRFWRMHGSVSNQFVAWNNSTRAAVQDLFNQILFAESLVERARSLRHKFAMLGNEQVVNSFVRKLLEHPEVLLDGAAEGKEGSAVKSYFENQQRQIETAKTELGDPIEQVGEHVSRFPEPAGREFIIRASRAFPTSGSRELPHRFYAVLMRNEFRLATAVSSDSTFF